MGKFLGTKFPGDAIIAAPEPGDTVNHLFTYPCNFTGVNSYLIKAVELQLQNWCPVLQSDILAEVQNEADIWGVTLWQNSAQTKFSLGVDQNVDSLTIRIFDENGKYINFRDSPWLLTLKVTYIFANPPPAMPLHHLISRSNHTLRNQDDSEQEQYAPVEMEPEYD